MLLPRTFKMMVLIGYLMIHLSRMTTSNIMLDNVWMNTIQNGPKLLILEIIDDSYKAT